MRFEFNHTATVRTTTPEGSQAMFEAMIDHKPLVDTRTPKDIANGVQIGS